jgi:hypothetical protein
VFLLPTFALALTLSASPMDRGLSEPSHVAGEYFVQRAGVSWLYQMPKGGRARVAITSFVDWRASFTFSYGKRSGGGSWRVKDGAWLERTLARGEGDMVLLPAVLKEGTRWTGPASLERGPGSFSQFEVMALNAVVDLPNGTRLGNCLAVLETKMDGSEPWTHYWAPNVGKVAVRGPDDWILQLLQFTQGQGHSE